MVRGNSALISSLRHSEADKLSHAKGYIARGTEITMHKIIVADSPRIGFWDDPAPLGDATLRYWGSRE